MQQCFYKKEIKAQRKNWAHSSILYAIVNHSGKGMSHKKSIIHWCDHHQRSRCEPVQSGIIKGLGMVQKRWIEFFSEIG